MKKLQEVVPSSQDHWVGDGFPVRTLFSHGSEAARFSPFLMLDYGGPMDFDATDSQRGVESHPHRGFETVTVIYHGEIGPGDVQWMTAASGIIHEEFHARSYAQTGGALEMAQLWVNLPARYKMTAPRYQSLRNAHIPVVALNEDSGYVRVIAGELQGHRGPAQTFTPVNLWDVSLRAGKCVHLPIQAGHTALLALLHGEVVINDEQQAREISLLVFSREGSDIVLKAGRDATILLMSGEPIDEPVATYGPFVMNTAQELQQAVTDYRSGKMGRIA